MRVNSSLLKRLSLLTIAIAAIFSSFQNCSNTKLVRADSISLGSVKGLTRLTPPKDSDGTVRIVILVDQSYSMIMGKCPGDLDGTKPDFNGSTAGCTPLPGIDPEAHRYDVIDSWIDQLIEDQSLDDPQIAIIPFSGGIKERPTKAELREANHKFKFLDLQTAKLWAKKLRDEHNSDLAKAEADVSNGPEFMGTTVPAPTLNYVYTMIEKEMTNLALSSQLETSKFKFIYMSDGAFKPIEPYLENALKLSGCPTQSECSSGSSHMACDAGSCGVGWTCGYQLCNSDWPNRFMEFFGDPVTNKFENIIDIVQKTLSLPEKLGGSSIDTHLVRIHPERLHSDEMDPPNSPPNRNIFDEIFKRIKSAKKWELKSSAPPFQILARAGNHASYKIDSFYAMNLNTFVDSFGRVVIDSDADGVPDDQESALGFDPLVARSNGICLDGLRRDYGCRTFGCIVSYDRDGDGLNECEERTVETNPDSADSDFDGLLDAHEVIRGLNPNRNEQNDVVTSFGSTDHQQFSAGVYPNYPIAKVPYSHYISLNVAHEDYTQESTPSGVVNVPLYRIEALNLPLVHTAPVTTHQILYRGKNNTGPTSKQTNLVGTSHAPSENEILFIARVVAIENPTDIYWLISRKTLVPQGPGHPVSVRLEFDELIQLPILVDMK